MNKRVKHGMHDTAIYTAWEAMIQRCCNRNFAQYRDYGKRGITVCYRWRVFENFYNDMGDKPEGMTLERKDNSKGYSKENCCWATRKAQANNRRTNRLVFYKDRTQTLMQWVEELGLNYDCVKKRLNRGWSAEKAFG